MNYLITYFIIINIVTFITFGLDKYYAIKNKFRVSESTLFCLCIIGGSFLGYVGMKVFRHKTKKLFFRIGVPLIMIIEGFILFKWIIDLL
jgi:uncharacterized membrane protein YsdA (DUF1294 family)